MPVPTFGKLRSTLAAAPAPAPAQPEVGTSGLTLGQDQQKQQKDSGPSDSTVSNAAQVAAGISGIPEMTKDQADSYDEKVEQFKNKPFLLNNPIVSEYQQNVSPMDQYQKDQQKLFKSNDDINKQLTDLQKKIEELQSSQPQKKQL